MLVIHPNIFQFVKRFSGKSEEIVRCLNDKGFFQTPCKDNR